MGCYSSLRLHCSCATVSFVCPIREGKLVVLICSIQSLIHGWMQLSAKPCPPQRVSRGGKATELVPLQSQPARLGFGDQACFGYKSAQPTDMSLFLQQAEPSGRGPSAHAAEGATPQQPALGEAQHAQQHRGPSQPSTSAPDAKANPFSSWVCCLQSSGRVASP